MMEQFNHIKIGEQCHFLCYANICLFANISYAACVVHVLVNVPWVQHNYILIVFLDLSSVWIIGTIFVLLNYSVLGKFCAEKVTNCIFYQNLYKNKL